MVVADKESLQPGRGKKRIRLATKAIWERQ